MMIATFNSNPCAKFISYSPINVIDESDLITFYKELCSLVRSIPKRNVLIIGGDMNTQIGKNENNKFCLHNSSNRLTCFNTKFQKRKGKQWTYIYSNNAKAKIDYILINKKWINNALNCKAYSAFDGVSSYQRIVTTKIRLNLRRNKIQTAKNYALRMVLT